MPTVANGLVLDWNVTKARGENLELELQPTPSLEVRILGYLNHANMGSYTNQSTRSLPDKAPRLISKPLVNKDGRNPVSAGTSNTT